MAALKRCNRCHLDLADSANWCSRCGETLCDASQPLDALTYCTECGAGAKATWKFCKRCGAKMEDVGGSNSRQPYYAPTIEELLPAIRTRCPQCRSPLNDDARFCDICGADVPRSASGSLSEPALRSLQDREPRTTELTPAVVSGPVALTFGGYANETEAHAADALAPNERKTFRRILVGLFLLIPLVLLGVLVRVLWFKPSVGQGPSQPIPSAAARETKKEVAKLVEPDLSVQAVEQEDQLAGGHAHIIVRMDDQALFILREEAGYASPFDRAKAVIENLRQAVLNFQRYPGAEFRVVDRPEGPFVVQVLPNQTGEKELPIVGITSHDVKAYARRSQGSVTPEQLARWWLNRLKDRVNLFVKGEASRLTATDEDGRLLAEVYDRTERESAGRAPTREALLQGFRALSPEQHRLLSYEGVRAFPNHVAAIQAKN